MSREKNRPHVCTSICVCIFEVGAFSQNVDGGVEGVEASLYYGRGLASIDKFVRAQLNLALDWVSANLFGASFERWSEILSLTH